MDNKDKLELARDWYNDQSATKKEKVLLENLFPELKENEDERIRKAIRNHIIGYDPNNEILVKEEGISEKQMLAWLEKQREREWNTDEKDKITNLKIFIAKCKGFNRENIQKAFDMIDSLKPQPHWKPTEEQMNCFKQAIDLFKMKVNDDLVLRILNSLYEQLIKL